MSRPRIYLSAWVQSADTLHVLVQTPTWAEDGACGWDVVHLSDVAEPAERRRLLKFGVVASHVVHVDVPEPTSFLLSPEGTLLVCTPDGQTAETVDESSDGPGWRGPLRDLQVIGACRMCVACRSRSIDATGPVGGRVWMLAAWCRGVSR